MSTAPGVSRHIPRVFQQPTAPPAPRDGDLWADTATHTLKLYAGGVWIGLGGAGAGFDVRAVGGARGDGVTDDSAAIRATCVAAAALGGTVVIPTGTYLVTSVNITGLHGLRVRGQGRGSVIKLGNAITSKGFYTLAMPEPPGDTTLNLTNDLEFRSLHFDGAGQLAMTNSNFQGGFGIDLQGGGAGLRVEDISSFRLGRSTLRTLGYTDIAIGGIDMEGLGRQQGNPQLQVFNTIGLYLRDSARIDLEDVVARDFPLRYTQGIAICPEKNTAVSGRPRCEDITLRGIRGYGLGDATDPINGAGGCLLAIYGYQSQDNVPRRVVIQGAITRDCADNNLWIQADDVVIDGFALEGASSGGGIEVLGKRHHLANGSIKNMRGHGVHFHTRSWDPAAVGADGGLGRMDSSGLRVSNVTIEDCWGPNGTGMTLENLLWNDPDGATTLKDVMLEGVTIRRTGQDGIIVTHLTEALRGGHVRIEEANRGTLATTTVAAPGASTSSPSVPVASSANFVRGMQIRIGGGIGTGGTVPANLLIGGAPDATHVTLVDNDGVPVNAPTAWPAGTVLSFAWPGNAALTYINNAAETATQVSQIDDLSIVDLQGSPTTQRGVYAEGLASPLRARLHTLGTFPQGTVVTAAGAVFEHLAGSRLGTLYAGLPVPQTSAPQTPPSGRMLWLPTVGQIRGRDAAGKDTLLVGVGPGGIVEVDDFAGGSVTSGSIGRWGWTTADIAGGTATASALTRTVAVGRPGLVQLDPGTGASNTRYFSSGSWLASDEELIVEFLLQQLVADTHGLVRAGVLSNGTVAVTTAGVNGFYFEKPFGGSNWTLVSVVNGVAGTPVDTGVAATTSSVLLRLRRTGGLGGPSGVLGATVLASLNNGSEVSIANNPLGTLSALANVGPFVHAGEDNGALHRVAVDRVSVECPALARY